jgi:hypothetical protein
MSETETALDVSNIADDPLLAGSLLGVALGMVERFLVHFQLTTLAVGLVVVGAVLARFGDRSSMDVGRALTAVGAASFVAFQALSLVFGWAPWRHRPAARPRHSSGRFAAGSSSSSHSSASRWWRSRRSATRSAERPTEHSTLRLD